MFASRPRGSRIVYVASSARELPEEVRRWLGEPEHSAACSPNIYDVLARLAGGARPTILIVSIDQVDWNEMEFFDRAASLSRNTSIYAVGHEHHAAKVDAACRRGARRFELEALEDDLSAPPPWTRIAGLTDLLAASLSTETPAPPLVRPVPPEPETVQDESVDRADGSSEAPPVRLVPATPNETEADGSAEPEAPPASIPFPWAPSPNRPQRTPPKTDVTGAASPASPAESGAGPSIAGNPAMRQPVELTPDELAALMGRPSAPERSTKEGLG